MVRVCLVRFGVIFGEDLACCSPEFSISGVEYRYPISDIGTQIQHWNLGIGIGTQAPLGLEYRYWHSSTDTSCRETFLIWPLLRHESDPMLYRRLFGTRVVYRSLIFGFDSGIPRVTISGRFYDWTRSRGLHLLVSEPGYAIIGTIQAPIAYTTIENVVLVKRLEQLDLCPC
ncbi:hypothetical protein GQ457_15G022710 [Hibiscus cannabinus]